MSNSSTDLQARPAVAGHPADAPRWRWRLTGLLLVALVVGTGVWWRLKAPRTGAAGATRSSFTQPFPSHPGPWGELEFVPIVIEPPDEFFSVTEQTNYELIWVFRKFSRAQLHDLFKAAGLSGAGETWLLDERNWRVFADGVVIAPPLDVILGLERPAREKIYSALAECGGNALQELPVSRSLTAVDDWFNASQLSPHTIALARSVLYRRGDSWCFSDWPAVLRRVESPAEQRRLLKTVVRQNTLLGRIRVGQHTDVEQLVAYWGRGGRSKDIRSVLESLALVEGGVTLDIVHLLPRFVRARAYTYPFPSDSPITPSCYWTSMNFFANEGPDDRFHDPGHMQRVLAADYLPVDGEFLLGDVLVLAKADGTMIHVASFIADNVVFTKNGAHHIQPWVLAKLEDMIASYPSAKPLTLRAYRRKDL